MNPGGFFEQRHTSPTAMAVVAAMHVAAVAALAAWKMDLPMVKVFTPLVVKNYVEPKPPEPQPIARPEKPRTTTEDITYKNPVIELPRDPAIIPTFPTDDRPTWTDVAGPASDGSATIAPPHIAPPAPIRVEAQFDQRFADRLQPPYPPSEQRAQHEGLVRMRVFIGKDGRVTRVEMVDAASDAFFRAAERQALRHWRFRPATLGGDPIATSKVMTIRFELNS